MGTIDSCRLAKAIFSNAAGLLDAIDRLLLKEEEDLKETLSKEGYLLTAETVALIHRLEDRMGETLSGQTDGLVRVLRDAEKQGVNQKELEQLVKDFLKTHSIAPDVAQMTEEAYTEQVPSLADAYMKETAEDMAVTRLRQSTSDWIQQWSRQLADMTKLTTEHQIGDMLTELNQPTKNNIAAMTQRILEGEWRSEYYQARRYALTEALRIHSVAHEEAIQQSPVVDRKEWRHSGGHKNHPRENHVKMDGQIVPKDQPFELTGRNGMLYHPMFPRDPILPPAESVNCHCIHRGVVNEQLAALPLEERQKLQEEALNKGFQGAGGVENSVQGEPVLIKTINPSDKTAIAQELSRAQIDFAGMNHEESITITSDGKVWHVKGESGAVNPWAIEEHGSSLKDSYSYHNHPANETNYSLSAEDVRYFFESGQLFSRASDNRYEYYMMRTAKTLDIDGETAYYRFKEIMRKDVYALSFDGEIDIDEDGYHEVMNRLSQEYQFSYARRRLSNDK